MNAIDIFNEAQPPLIDPIRNVLVIGHEDDGSAITDHLLDDQNARTIHARTSDQAVSTLLFVQPDVIVLDATMEQDGHSLVRILRDAPETREVPIIATCAPQDLDKGIRSIRNGANDLLLTPVNPAVMQACIDAMMTPHLEASPFQQGYRAMITALQIDDTLRKLSGDLRSAADMDPDTVGACLEDLHGDRHMLKDSIRRIHEYARMRLGRFEPEQKRTVMAGLVLSAIEGIAKQHMGTPPTIRWMDHTNGAKVWVDTDLTERIVRHLLAKALKHGSDTVHVTIEIRNDSILLSIEDDGPGIPRCDRDSVLNVERKAPRHPGRKPAALRLPYAGLATRTQGGRLWIETSEMGGNAFRMTVPRYRKRIA